MAASKRSRKRPAPKVTRGRPKTSALDPVAQARERQRRRRDKKRKEGKIAVEIWIKQDWHEAILGTGINLQEAAEEAFASWLSKKRGKPKRLQ